MKELRSKIIQSEGVKNTRKGDELFYADNGFLDGQDEAEFSDDDNLPESEAITSTKNEHTSSTSNDNVETTTTAVENEQPSSLLHP